MSGDLTDDEQAAVRAFLNWAIPAIWRTQEEAGKALRVSQEYVSQAKNGRKPIGLSLVHKISKVLDVSFDDLVRGRASERLANPPMAMSRSPQAGRRSMTPTPTPSSSLRFGKTVCEIPETPGRQRALELLVERGFDPGQVDEEFALLAFDAALSPLEDRPPAWWIDGVRSRLKKTAQ